MKAKLMHKLIHLFETKLLLTGGSFIVLNLANFNIILKIVGSIIFIAYLIRKWYLMEKTHDTNDK